MGRDLNRPELQDLFKFTRDGDIVIVHSTDRLARNLDDFVVERGGNLRLFGIVTREPSESPMGRALVRRTLWSRSSAIPPWQQDSGMLTVWNASGMFSDVWP